MGGCVSRSRSRATSSSRRRLTNVAKYAHASAVIVVLVRKNETLVDEVLSGVGRPGRGRLPSPRSDRKSTRFEAVAGFVHPRGRERVRLRCAASGSSYGRTMPAYPCNESERTCGEKAPWACARSVGPGHVAGLTDRQRRASALRRPPAV